MKDAKRALLESSRDAVCAYGDMAHNLGSVRGLMGRPSKGRACKHLKHIGAALLLTPTPEPFSDAIGLALIGVGTIAERMNPLTLAGLSEEGGEILREVFKFGEECRNLSSDRQLGWG